MTDTGRDDIQECFSDYLAALVVRPEEPADLYESFEAGYLFGEQATRAACDARAVALASAAQPFVTASFGGADGWKTWIGWHSSQGEAVVKVDALRAALTAARPPRVES